MSLGRPLSKHDDVKALLGRAASRAVRGRASRRAGGPGRNSQRRRCSTTGRPMPTRYWLVGRQARLAVDRLEAAGRSERRRQQPSTRSNSSRPTSGTPPKETRPFPMAWLGHDPGGGVGGTRRGVKCLHAHYAWYLVGGDDPVGRWVAEQLARPGAAGRPVPRERWVTSPPIDCGTLSTRLLISTPSGQPDREAHAGDGPGTGRRPVQGAAARGDRAGPFGLARVPGTDGPAWRQRRSNGGDVSPPGRGQPGVIFRWPQRRSSGLPFRC